MTDNGGPAFPFEYDGPSIWGTGPQERTVHPGMTLRDYFAGRALPQAILDYSSRRRERPDEDHSLPVTPYATKGVGTREEIISRQAYKYADAMLKVREE